MKKEIKNIWSGKGSIHLELGTGDVGKGLRHINLESGKSIIVEESELTEHVKALAGLAGNKKMQRRRLADPVLSITDAESDTAEVAAKYTEKVIDSITEVKPAVETAEPYEPDFICEECGESFSSLKALKKHKKTHS